MKQTIEHIDVPLDEIGIFKSIEQQKYQNILIQTVILTTLGTIHDSDKNYKASIFITIKSIWIIKKQKLKITIPIRSVVGVVKSFKHPELVIITSQEYSNIRITTSSQQRTWYIISALSYDFTYVYNKKLIFISVKHGSLDYFQRTAEDKKNNRNINLDSYKKQEIQYKKPFKDSTNIYGYIKQKAKIILQKQIQLLLQSNNSHAVYLARIKDNKLEEPKESQKQHMQDRYICHYIDKKNEYLQTLYEHKNLNFITELMYAKATDFKIQIFFEYSTSLRGLQITPFIFHKMWVLYDQCKNLDKNCVITTDSFQLVQRNGILGQKIKRKDSQSDLQQKLRWLNGQYQILMRQFRYDFLNEACQWDTFIYQLQSGYEKNTCKNIDQRKSKSSKQQSSTNYNQNEQYQQQITNDNKENIQVQNLTNSDNEQAEIRYFKSKIYNMGHILYELTTGRHLYSYVPAFVNQNQVLQEQIRLIVQFKQMTQKQEFNIYPEYLDLGLSQTLKKFISSCLFRSFKNQKDLFADPWLKNSQIIKI